jgi:hypothetical protein
LVELDHDHPLLLASVVLDHLMVEQEDLLLEVLSLELQVVMEVL